MITGPADGTDPPPREAAHQFFLRHLEIKDRRELPAHAQEALERLRLGHSARKAIQDKAILRIRLAQALPHQSQHCLVRDHAAVVNQFGDPAAGCSAALPGDRPRAARPRLPQHLAGG